MNEIVTLAEARMWLRVDQTWEDDTIQDLVDAATETALATADGYDPMGLAQPPASLRLAILTHVARAFQDREEGSDAPAGNARLLARFRRLEV